MFCRPVLAVRVPPLRVHYMVDVTRFAVSLNFTKTVVRYSIVWLNPFLGNQILRFLGKNFFPDKNSQKKNRNSSAAEHLTKSEGPGSNPGCGV